MAKHVPDGVVKFYQNVKPDMFWLSRSEQNAYYNTHYVSSISDNDYSYIKHTEGAIKVPLSYAQSTTLYNCNYLSFTCSGEDKIYYAQILDFERSNNEMVIVYFGIDWYQTDWDRYRIDYCQIDRESTPLGAYITGDMNTKYTPEPLVYGDEAEPLEYNVISGTGPVLEPGDRWLYDFTQNRFRAVLIAIENEKGLAPDDATFGTFDMANCVTTNVSTSDTAVAGLMLNKDSATQMGVYALRYSSYPQPFYVVIQDLTDSGLAKMQAVLNQYGENDMTSSIIGLYYIPDFVYAPRLDGQQVDTTRIGHEFIINLDIDTGKKYNYYPYCYLRATLTDGTQKLYRIDEFSTSSLTFILSGNVGTGVPVASLIPCNYRGQARNFTERLTLPAFPTIPYCIDGDIVYRGQVFTNLLQTNGSKIQAENNRLEYNTLSEQSRLYKEGMLSANSGEQGFIDYATRSLGAGNLLHDAYQNIQSFREGSRAMYDLTAQNKARAAEIANMTGAAASDIGRARRTGAPIASNSFANDFVAPNAMMQDYYSPASGDITPIVGRANGILFDIVTIRNDLKVAYDRFFNLFGYKSGSIRRPCLSHNAGNTSIGDTEALACFDEDPFDTNYRQGYIKCSDISISGVHQESAEWIRQKFLGGTVFHRSA